MRDNKTRFKCRVKYLNFWHLNTRLPFRLCIFMIFPQFIDVTRIPTNLPPTNHCIKRKHIITKSDSTPIWKVSMTENRTILTRLK